MRFLAVFSLCMIMPALAACGSDSTRSATVNGAKSPQQVVGSAKPPKVRLPPGPPPKKLLVKDIRRGAGASVPPRGGVKIDTNFVAVSYRTGKTYEVRWKPDGSFDIGFGPGSEIKGWERGLVGMKVGGRRELRVPSKLAYGQGALVYVIDLLAIE
jgi:peptidylprolyl isomerase